MDIVRNLSFSKLIRIDQDDLDEAIRDFCIKKSIVEDIDKYEVKLPLLGTDLIHMEWKFDE